MNRRFDLGRLRARGCGGEQRNRERGSGGNLTQAKHARLFTTTALLVLSLVVVLLSGCRPRETSSSAARPLELLVSSEPETLDPRHAVDAVSHRVTRLVHAGLTSLDPDTLEPKPLLAERITRDDERTVRIDLKSGITFHSGAPLRSRDVVASLRAYMDPSISARTARAVEPIASVEETGERSLVIRLRRPHATLLGDIELPILRADEATAPPRPRGDLDGLGPYRIAHVAPGSVSLVPASGGPIHAEHAVTIRTVRDENARALRLLAGRADVAVNVLSPTLLPALEQSREGLAVRRRTGANVTYVLLRVDRAPFDRIAARRAITLGIDRQAITTGLLAGAARPASGVIPPSLWAAPQLEPLPFDRSGAASNVRLNGGLRFTLLTTPDRVRLSIARTVAQALADVGAAVDVVTLELGALLARLTRGDFDAAILNIPEVTDPNVLRIFLHSASIPPAGANRGHVKDEILDGLLDEGARTSDEAARKKVYAALETRLREECWFVPLWHEEQVAVTSERARRFTPSAEGRWSALTTVP